MDHQRDVLEDWHRHEERGVVNFATGAGKTLTAIEAVNEWTTDGGSALILVPGKDLHDQWLRELDAELPNAQILRAGAGHGQTVWGPLLTRLLFARYHRAAENHSLHEPNLCH